MGTTDGIWHRDLVAEQKTGPLRSAGGFLAERKTGQYRTEGRHNGVREPLPLTPFVLLLFIIASLFA
jgi:hypothetical protein